MSNSPEKSANPSAQPAQPASVTPTATPSVAAQAPISDANAAPATLAQPAPTPSVAAPSAAAKSDAAQATAAKPAPAQPTAAAKAQSAATPAPATAQTASQPTAAPSSALDFRTENIGRWKAQQESPFAEQNRRDAEKQAKRDAKRQKALPILRISGIVLGALVVIAVIATVVIISIKNAPEPPLEIGGSSTEDVSKYQQLLQEVYDQALLGGSGSSNSGSGSGTGGTSQSQSDALQAVDEAVNGTLGTSNGSAYEQQVLLAQVLFLSKNNQNQAAIDLALTINVDALDLDQKAVYYYTLSDCYAGLHDLAKAEEYYEIAIPLVLQVGNGSDSNELTAGDAAGE